MKFLAAFGIASLFLFASCAKEEVDGFDSHIKVASDFKVDPATGDTFYRFYMPNGFTPNQDGLNDIYYTPGVGFDYDDFEMKIFSRENNLIYYTTDSWRGWDGRVQGGADMSAMGLYTVEVNVGDTSHEQHHYVYEAFLYR